MFMGEYRHKIDTKGRLIIPADFRDELQDKMVVTKGLDGCLAIYTMEQWQEEYEKLKQLPTTNRKARMYVHMIMAKAAQCELDAHNRIRIPAHLVKEAELEKDCVIVGVSDHVEIWNEEKWDAYYDVASENFEDIAESLTEYLI
ncbi:MAG TPA: division/cell wall cluster transcriptional repressor MraZ [Erysipelothrix sp.]